MKLREKWLATGLRKKGLSYGEILEKMSVSKSTLSKWLRDINLTSKQQKRLRGKMDKVRYAVAKRKVANRIEQTRKIIGVAKKEIPTLINNPLFVSGLALYWAEGAKNQEESVKLVNSDPQVILLSMRWFRELCHVPENKFRIQVHIHNLHSRKNVEKYWSRVTKIKRDNFYKTYIKNSSLGHRRNILYNGTCSIVIHDKTLFRRILGWKLGLQETLSISP